MFDLDYGLPEIWLEEARAEAKQENPLRGYCRRVYFERTTCKRRKGHAKAGTKRKYRSHEVELLKFLPSGRCVAVKDLRTPGLDALAEEIFAGKYIPPDINVAQLFLDYSWIISGSCRSTMKKIIEQFTHEWVFDLPWHMVYLKDWFYMINVGCIGSTVFLHVRVLGVRSLWAFSHFTPTLIAMDMDSADFISKIEKISKEISSIGQVPRKYWQRH